MPSGMGRVPVSGVMAFGRLVGSEVADVAVSPVTVLVDGATMMVVGNQDSEESVIVEMGTKLLPRLSEDTVVMLGRVAEEVVDSSVVTGGVVSVVSVAGIVTLGGSDTVVGNSAVVVPASVEFWDTVASVVVGRKEVLTSVVGKPEMVVFAVIGISVLVGSASVPVTVVPLPISVALGRGVVVVMPVPGPVAEGSTVWTEDPPVVEMIVVPVPGPVADASIVDTVVGEGVPPVPGPVAEASIVDSVDVGEVTPVPGPVAEGSTVGPAVSVAEAVSESLPLVEVGPARPLDRSDKILLKPRPAEEDGVTIPVGAITMPELEAELATELAPVGIGPVVVPVSTVPIEDALLESAADVGTVSSPDWVLEGVESLKLVAVPVAVVASVASDVRLVGCTISLGTGPVEAPVLVVAVTSDTRLLKSEVMGSPVGSNPVSVADPVADSVADSVVDSVADPVADSTAESEEVRLVGCTTSLGTVPVEAPLLLVAVISEIILPKSEVRGRPVDDSLVLVTAVSIELALGVASEERAVVASDTTDEDGGNTVVSAAVDDSVKIVVLSAEVAVGTSLAEVAVETSSAEVAVDASLSVVLVLAGGGSLGETMAVSDAAVLALLVSDRTSLAVVIKTGPDGPRLVRMSDNERL